jgi:hypothetical protein
MIRNLIVSIALLLTPLAGAEEFKHFGTFILKSHFKVAGARVTPVPMKPMVFQVSTDGVQVRVSAEGDDEARTTFEIYRSDGIGRPRAGAADLEVIPGVQAMSKAGGVLRHLRLTRESFTITTFPGVSDQTIISHAIANPTAAAPTPQPTKP